MLSGIRDVSRLQQWLYADPSHNIIVENAMQARLRLTMDETGQVLCETIDPPGKPTPYDDMLGLPVWLGILEQLEHQPPVSPRIDAASRWEEIKLETAFLTVMNT